MPKIIISYRRSDSDVFAGRIRDRLAARFGEESVFIDVDNIPFGKDFRVHIQDALATADAVLVIIGSRWLGGGKGGRSRIMDATDPVRIEVEAALSNRSPTFPILVGQTCMPKPEQLPQSLQNFAFINAAPVDTGRDFHRDLGRVISTLEAVIVRPADDETAQTGAVHDANSGAEPKGTAATRPLIRTPSSVATQSPTVAAKARRAKPSSRYALTLSVSLVTFGLLSAALGWFIIRQPTQGPTMLQSGPTAAPSVADAPVIHLLPPTVNGDPIQAVIDARQTWQASALIVQGSGRITFRAVGAWIFNPAFPAVDANGNGRFSTEGRMAYAFSGPGGREGQLIGRVGTGAPFIVGTDSSHFIAGGESGPVYLVINDDLTGGTGGSGLSDNTGSLTVTLQQLAQ